MARILARKRDLPVDVCTVGALLHDIYVIIHGRYKDHAHLGAPIAVQILTEIGGFSDTELDQVYRIVYHHSDKHVWSDDPFQEIGKDADILDCFLIPNPYGDYLRHKSPYILSHYLKRAEKVWQELGIPTDPGFELLRNYSSSWFEPLFTSKPESVEPMLSVLLALSDLDEKEALCPPAFCLLARDGQVVFYTNRDNWVEYVQHLQAVTTYASVQAPDAIRDALELSLATHPEAEEIRRILLDVHGSFVAERVTKQAAQLLRTAIEKQCAVMFWPAVDVYEILDGEQMWARLEELGIG